MTSVHLIVKLFIELKLCFSIKNFTIKCSLIVFQFQCHSVIASTIVYSTQKQLMRRYAHARCLPWSLETVIGKTQEEEEVCHGRLPRPRRAVVSLLTGYSARNYSPMTVMMGRHRANTAGFPADSRDRVSSYNLAIPFTSLSLRRARSFRTSDV